MFDLIRPGGVDSAERDMYAALAARLRPKGYFRPHDAGAPLPDDWKGWLRAIFPSFLVRPGKGFVPFAPRHEQFWPWAWEIEPGVSPRSICCFWPRGGAKSTTLEMATGMVAARRTRKYGLYICETQEQADGHVETIGGMLGSERMAAYYPETAERRVDKYGRSIGWRRSRVTTTSGFTIDAIGLDSARRGAKVDEDRPDWIVIDDVDDVGDSPPIVEGKIRLLTNSLLPAGSDDVAVAFVQNVIHADGIAGQLIDGRADFLQDRIMLGPEPALIDPEYAQKIDPDTGRRKWYVVAGTPTWEGQDVKACQNYIDKFGFTAFDSECQHNVNAKRGGMYDTVDFEHVERADVPPIVRYAVWLDPAVSSTDRSDSCALQVDGLGVDGKVYRFYSWERRSSPQDAMKRGLLKCVEYGCPSIGVETDQGGDTWESVYNEAWTALEKDPEIKHIWGQIVREDTRTGEVLEIIRESSGNKPGFKSEKAGATGQSKIERQGHQLAMYEGGMIVHVLGTHGTLEGALRRFGVRKPFDLADASYWSSKDLKPSADAILGVVAQGYASGWQPEEAIPRFV